MVRVTIVAGLMRNLMFWLALTYCAISIISAQSCLHPSGDCSWYRHCLAVKYPTCGNSGYPLGYGEKYCLLFQQNFNKFSPKAKAWINATRKCLQVKLAPVLQAKANQYTCEKIKLDAFKSHVPCYVNPAPGISVCDLGVTEFTKIFNVVKGSLLTDLFATVNQMAGVARGCGWKL